MGSQMVSEPVHSPLHIRGVGLTELIQRDTFKEDSSRRLDLSLRRKEEHRAHGGRRMLRIIDVSD